MKSGGFITFEGIEGSGKSTQIQLVCDLFRAQGHAVIQTKEPGATPLGAILRGIILDKTTVFSSPFTELLLFYADRMEHIESIVKPALADGKIVVCDRYIDSTIAYQVGARQMPRLLVDTLTQYVGIMPDLTILLDITETEGLKRAKARAELDRFETETIDFHQKIRAKYLEQASLHPNRIEVIHVEHKPIETIFKEIQTILKKRGYIH